MPNWCSTTVIFYGDQAKVSAMYDDIVRIFDPLRLNLSYLGLWLEYKNAEPQLIEHMHIRGYIEDIRYDGHIITICSSDAWRPCHVFYALMASYYEVDYELFAEEHASDIFLTTDVQHRFFPKECRIQVNLPTELLEYMPAMRFLSECSDIIKEETLIRAFQSEFPAMNIKSVDDIVHFLTLECKLTGAEPRSAFRIRTLDYEPKLFVIPTKLEGKSPYVCGQAH